MSPADPGGFRRLDDEVVHWSGRFLEVVTGTFEGPDGTNFQRDVVHHPGAVGVVPLTDAGEVVLVRQYRAALDRWLLEIPAGLRDVPGEDPAATAARELAEEVGLAASSMTLLTIFHNSPGFTDEAVHVYLAKGLRPVTPDAQGLEEQHMETLTVPLDAALDDVRTGEITDAKTVIGLLLAGSVRSGR